MRPRALVLFNAAAQGGRAEARFDVIRGAVHRAFEPEIVRLQPDSDWRRRMRDALSEGVGWFVAAGGDGTVNALIGCLVDAGAPMSVGVGAVGLGSSNDFHKPARRLVQGVPVRLDCSSTSMRDLVRVRWETSNAVMVVSASIGLAAEANALFTAGDRILRCLKPWSSQTAILWAAGRTLARYRNLGAEMVVDGEVQRYAVTNLSVLETPWLSGIFHYDTPVDPGDGMMTVNLLEGASRARALRMLARLARGRFLAARGAHSWTVRTLEVRLDAPAALEIDGEVVRAQSVHFQVMPRRIRVCDR
jgi:diacylglycerol kinase family enzyme